MAMNITLAARKIMDLFSYHPSYPEAPGYQATSTSKAAAEAIAPRTPALQARVLHAIRLAGTNGLTMEEVATVIGEGRHSVQPRTSELRLKGKIKDSGFRRPLESGRAGIVWVAV